MTDDPDADWADVNTAQTHPDPFTRLEAERRCAIRAWEAGQILTWDAFQQRLDEIDQQIRNLGAEP